MPQHLMSGFKSAEGLGEWIRCNLNLIFSRLTRMLRKLIHSVTDKPTTENILPCLTQRLLTTQGDTK